MKKTITKFGTGALALGIFIVACSPEEQVSTEPINNAVSFTATVEDENTLLLEQLSFETGDLEDSLIDDVHFSLANAVVPSECAPTAFNDAINTSVNSNLDFLGSFYFDLYGQINQLYARFLDQGPHYFGADGEYTNYVVNRTRSLEKFWNMPNEITVKGQHNSTLNDRDKIAAVYINFAGLTEEQAYANADTFQALNEASTFLNESPLLSFDGFATSNNLIVIGDGLVELASEAGVEDKIVWSGILAHEWAHQIQFDNFSDWYPNGAADNAPEATRTTKLEADFIAAYYLTHKKGATYNWKRVADFFELFFNIGDCSFTSSGHHGTPLQRMEAARLGYVLATQAHKQGHIMSTDDVHEAFINVLGDIVGDNVEDYTPTAE